MNKKKTKTNKFRNVLAKLLGYFTVIFTMFIAIYLIISLLCGDYSFSLLSILYIFVISILLTVIFYFFLKIDRIKIITQIVSVYSLFSIFSYAVCFLLGLFSFNNANEIIFFFISLAICLVGLVILSCILMLKRHRETQYLNAELKQFKERDGK